MARFRFHWLRVAVLFWLHGCFFRFFFPLLFCSPSFFPAALFSRVFCFSRFPRLNCITFSFRFFVHANAGFRLAPLPSTPAFCPPLPTGAFVHEDWLIPSPVFSLFFSFSPPSFVFNLPGVVSGAGTTRSFFGGEQFVLRDPPPLLFFLGPRSRRFSTRTCLGLFVLVFFSQVALLKRVAC